MLNTSGWAFAAPTLPALADATDAQKQATAKSIRESLQREKRCQAVCAEMMHNQESRTMMIRMIMKDPECLKMMKAA